MAKSDLQQYPRLLVIDATRTGGLSATGQIKKNLLRGWPEKAFMQLYASKLGDYHLAVSLVDSGTDRVFSTEESLLEEVASFKPEVIYYRPLLDQHQLLHFLALEIMKRHPVPVVSHIMDDWPERLRANDPLLAEKLDCELHSLFTGSYRVLSISEQMSQAFAKRYGVNFEVIANGVDLKRYSNLKKTPQTGSGEKRPLVLRYTGALAKNMTFQTVVDLARAVDSLQERLPVRLEVYTMPSWRRAFEKAVQGYRGVFVYYTVPDQDYPRLLSEADVLVLAYNFDPVSLGYIGYSMPNKLPEYLASGTPVLAIGPRGLPGIDYLTSRDLAFSVCKRDFSALCEAIELLVKNPAYREKLGKKGQKWAFRYFDLREVAGRFQQILRQASRAGSRAKTEAFVDKDDPLTEKNRALFKLQIVQAETGRACRLLNGLLSRQEKLELDRAEKREPHYGQDLSPERGEQLRKENQSLLEQLKRRDLANYCLRNQLKQLTKWLKRLEPLFKGLLSSKSWWLGRKLRWFSARLRAKKVKPVKEKKIREIFIEFAGWGKNGKP